MDFGAVSLQLLAFLPVLLFYTLVIFFTFKLLSFMKTKLQLDRERNQKLDQLIEKHNIQNK